MDVASILPSVRDSLSQDLLDVRAGESRPEREEKPNSAGKFPVEEQGRNIPADRVEIQGDRLLYYSSQEISFDQKSLVVRPDGTYAYRQVSLEASQEIAISLDFGPGGMAGIDMEAVEEELQQLVSDLQQGFRDSLRNLVGRLRSQQQPENLQGTSPLAQMPGLNTNPEGQFELGDSDDKLVNDYLILIRQLTGEDSKAGKLARQVQEMLELGKDIGESVEQAAASAQSFRFRMTRLEASSTTVEIQFGGSGEEVQEGEPLVLDLNGNGVELRSMEEGVSFDIDNDGVAEQTGFVTGGDGLLALDKNGNGKIDGVAELFGDKNGARNGFEDLSRYDANNDRRIDSQDPVFEQLRVYQDLNGNGRSETEELKSLAEHDIASIDLRPVANPYRVAGNRISHTASFNRNDGSTGTVAEAWFRYRER